MLTLLQNLQKRCFNILLHLLSLVAREAGEVQALIDHTPMEVALQYTLIRVVETLCQ